MAEDLAKQLQRERFALSALLEFVRTLTPDLGADGIIKSVLRTIRGKSLISGAFGYLRVSHSATPTEYRFVSRSGFRGFDLPATVDDEWFDSWTPEARQSYPGGGFNWLTLEDPNGNGMLGFIGFGKSLSPAFNLEEEVEYLESLSILTEIALVNAELFQKERERQRYESELRVAREIQKSLLPQRLPEMPGLSFAAESMSSELVGGDYYDLIELSPTRLLFAIADVVGKGIGAALTMSNVQAALRSLASLIRSGNLGLSEIVAELNRLTFESTSTERFITAAFGLLDTESRELEMLVCGHPFPIIVTDKGELIELPSSGIPLGIFPSFEFLLRKLTLEPGSTIVLYTDGLSEATGADGEMLGRDGIHRILSDHGQTDEVGSLLLRLMDAEKRTINDDVTLLLIRLTAKLEPK